MTDLKLAESDARKPLRIRPVLTADKPVHDVDSIQVEIGTEERVQQENLSDGIRQVKHLDRQICGNQVVTVKTAANDAADLGDEVLDAHHAASFVFSLRQEIAVHLVDDVANCFLADLEVRRSAADARRIHDRRQVDAGSFVEKAPEQRRHGGEHGLEQKYEWNPLVVADERRATLRVSLPHHDRCTAAADAARTGADTGTAGGDHGESVGGNCLLDRQVVGVAYPADGVGVVAVTVGELGRTPAGDRTPDELLRADEEREADQHDDGVLATQSVDVIVVSRQLYLADA